MVDGPPQAPPGNVRRADSTPSRATGSTRYPVSSSTSRTTVSYGSSPCSVPPPGSVHCGGAPAMFSRASRTRPSRTHTPYAATLTFLRMR